ncbi:MAG: hypothetical protein WBS20_02770 [Lysobacterales bacterium]
MKISMGNLMMVSSVLLALGAFSSQVAAQITFSDNFEDRVKDQALIGNNWTWYNQTFADNTCSGEPAYGYGPYDDGNPSDYQQENRNYWTASADVGQGDSYFRAGLEVPAWSTDEGDPVVLSNMLRVYGDQNYDIDVTTCKRTLIFQEMTASSAGTYVFSFDVAQDRYGAPQHGEMSGAFVKVLKSSDQTYDTVLFEKADTNPPVATTPENVTTVSQQIEFTITADMVGELLQFGFYVDLSENLGQGWDTSATLYDNVQLGPMEIGPAHSGSYYNAGQSGHGFSIEFGQTPGGPPLAVVYWYSFDDQGNPIFMLGNGIVYGNRVEINFESPVGMVYGVFDPDTVDREIGGTAVFEFSDRENATFSYTPSDFSKTTWGHLTPIVDLPLVKLFGIPADKYFETP